MLVRKKSTEHAVEVVLTSSRMKAIPCDPDNPGCRLAMSDDWNLNFNEISREDDDNAAMQMPKPGSTSLTLFPSRREMATKLAGKTQSQFLRQLQRARRWQASSTRLSGNAW